MSKADKNDIFNEEETLESLFKSAKSLEIIPPGFSPDFFRKYFFLFFIERHYSADDDKTDFSKLTFGEKYYQSMLRAFDFVFKNAKTSKLDLSLINQVFLIASDKSLEQQHRRYRTKPCQSGFEYSEASICYRDGVIDKNFDAKLNLTGRLFGKYYYVKAKTLNDLPNSLILRCDLRVTSEDKIIAEVENLLQEYHARMQKIKDDEKLPAKKQSDKKVELIAIFINDFVRYHPYMDGNGRLSCFLLLNFLLIQENLTPSLTFDPWYLSYSMVEELPDLVREGQVAYEKYFVSQLGISGAEELNEMTNPALKKRYVGAEKQVQITVLNLCGILCVAWQIKAIANSTNADLQMHKQYLQNLLGDALDLVYCSDYEISLKDILPYQLPVETKWMIGEVAAQGTLSLFDRDALEADKTELRKKYKSFFDAELYEKDKNYKDEKIDYLLEFDLAEVRKNSIDVIVGAAERLLPKIPGENFYEENLMEKYCNDEQFRYRVLEELPQKKYQILFKVEVLNSLIPFCDRPAKEEVLDFDYEAIRTRLYEKRLFDYKVLSKKNRLGIG